MPDKNQIGDAFASALRGMLRDAKPKLTVAAAAGQLEVSRQAFHAYLNGTLPRKKTLNRAMHMWKLKLDLGKDSFDSDAFGPDEARKKEPATKPAQLAFWEALDTVTEKDLHVTMKRVGRVLRFNVRVEIPA